MIKTAILICNCRDVIRNLFHDEKIHQILDGFDLDIYLLDDICSLALKERAIFEKIELGYSHKIILACYPRAVENLFLQFTIQFTNYRVINHRETINSDCLERILQEESIPEGKARFSAIESNLNVPSWFPVIDRSSCTLCGKCARFCLFGVYAFTDKKLEVVNPLACKNLCPACARSCPSSAILFPKLNEGGVIAGAIPDEFHQKVIIGEGNITARLSQRNQLHQSVLKSGFLRQADEERNKALEEMKKINTSKND